MWGKPGFPHRPPPRLSDGAVGEAGMNPASRRLRSDCFGMALVMTPTTAAAMGSVPVAKAGVGSAVINSMRQVGGSLGIAVMGAVVATQTHARPRDPAAFVTGYHHALYVGAAISLVGAFLAVATVRQVRHEHAAHAPEAVGA